MKKNTLNYLIDIVMFILMMAILGVGLLMKFVLISGQERWDKFGRNVDMYFWGMDRHDWGRIHLIMGLLLIAVLVIHLILHWKSILAFFRNAFPAPALRFIVAALLIAISCFLVFSPFFLKVTVSELESGYGRRRNDKQYTVADTSQVISPESQSAQQGSPVKPRTIEGSDEDVNKPEHKRQELAEEIEIRGYMTLQEISLEYDVSAELIKEKLNIPLSTSDNERLGRLRNLYGFTMSDVRDIIYAEREGMN
jgi:hypothetical protein